MLDWIANKFVGGAAEGVVGAAQGVANIVDQFVETDDEKRVAEQLKLKMMQQPLIAQQEINKIEAGHRTIFVAGWRPWIGWVAGWSLFFYFIPQYIMGAVIWVKACWQVMQTTTITAGNITSVLPPYPVTADGLLELVFALLGIGGLRTLEKMTGRSK